MFSDWNWHRQRQTVVYWEKNISLRTVKVMSCIGSITLCTVVKSAGGRRWRRVNILVVLPPFVLMYCLCICICVNVILIFHLYWYIATPLYSQGEIMRIQCWIPDRESLQNIWQATSPKIITVILALKYHWSLCTICGECRVLEQSSKHPQTLLTSGDSETICENVLL